MNQEPDFSAAPGQNRALCPVCKKPGDKSYRPFCSKRCADLDLGKWLGGAYAIPTAEPATSAEEFAELASSGQVSPEGQRNTYDPDGFFGSGDET